MVCLTETLILFSKALGSGTTLLYLALRIRIVSSLKLTYFDFLYYAYVRVKVNRSGFLP